MLPPSRTTLVFSRAVIASASTLIKDAWQTLKSHLHQRRCQLGFSRAASRYKSPLGMNQSLWSGISEQIILWAQKRLNCQALFVLIFTVHLRGGQMSVAFFFYCSYCTRSIGAVWEQGKQRNGTYGPFLAQTVLNVLLSSCHKGC